MDIALHLTLAAKGIQMPENIAGFTTWSAEESQRACEPFPMTIPFSRQHLCMWRTPVTPTPQTTFSTFTYDGSILQLSQEEMDHIHTQLTAYLNEVVIPQCVNQHYEEIMNYKPVGKYPA